MVDNMKRKGIVTKSCNLKTQDDIINVKTEACNNLPDLPIDIILDIISRLHVKLIVACKSLSKAFKNLISDPSFSLIYNTNKSNYFHAIFVEDKKGDCSFDLAELDKREIHKEKGNYKISNTGIFNTKRLPGGSRNEWILLSIFSYCNGLICVVVVESGLYNLFVINPLLGEFIQLPQPVIHNPSWRWMVFSYGIGYCQFSNRYKVLRITAEYFGNWNLKYNSEIFTIGYDQNWRSVRNIPPCNIFFWCTDVKPRSVMVPFRSALHWIKSYIDRLITNEPVRVYICAFDMTEEKLSTFQLPNEVDGRNMYGLLSVLLDKLCMWRRHEFDLWVMNEYGVEGSWTKQFVLKRLNLPTDIYHFSLTPLIVLPEGVIVLSDWRKVVFYDMKKQNCLRVIHQSTCVYYPVPFAPNFVSLRNLVQGPGLMMDVQPCSPVFIASLVDGYE